MARKREKGIILTEPGQQQVSVEFNYLSHLCVSEATILEYLQLPPQKEPEGKPENLAVASA